MTTADIADLRKQASQVIAQLGSGLLALEDIESLLAAPHITALLHEQVDNAAAAFESAASHLAELVTAVDKAAIQLRPQGLPATQ